MPSHIYDSGFFWFSAWFYTTGVFVPPGCVSKTEAVALVVAGRRVGAVRRSVTLVLTRQGELGSRGADRSTVHKRRATFQSPLKMFLLESPMTVTPILQSKEAP